MANDQPRKQSLSQKFSAAFRAKSSGSGRKLSKAPPASLYPPNGQHLSSGDLSSRKDSLNSIVPTKSDVSSSISYSYSQSGVSLASTPASTRVLGLAPAVNFYNKKNNTAAGSDKAQTGELWDEAEMLHSLLRRDSHDSLNSMEQRTAAAGRERRDNALPDPNRRPGEDMIASLPADLWIIISAYLESPTDAANLAFASKTLLDRLGEGPWKALNEPENHQAKIDFLLPMDRYLPIHLFCFPCAVYHLRIQSGLERLKPTMVLNPLFNCPNPTEQSRLRLTPGHTLPFSIIQLVFRHEKYGPEYGIPLSTLNKRYKCPESSSTSTWSHHRRFLLHKNHLLMRITSKTFVVGGLPPSAERHLLYSRDDYWPYFSACAHWRDGDLMPLAKCALSHLPPPAESLTTQLKRGPTVNMDIRRPTAFVTLCATCRPMRRCPECATEYLVEMKLEEDKLEPDRARRFKQCMQVTRWSDLGDGKDPGRSEEWCAVTGERSMDSFERVGRRGVSGVFESASGVTAGQRMVSLNPRKEKLGERGHGWY